MVASGIVISVVNMHIHRNHVLVFWQKKFQSNIDRDRTVRETLKSHGIRMIVIWECTAKKAVKDNAIITDIYNEIVQSGSNRFNLLHLLP